MGEFSAWHVLIIAAVFVLLFGYKKLPDATRSLGRSLRILQAETRGLREDGEDEPVRSVEAGPASPPAVSTVPVTLAQPITTTQRAAAPVKAPSAGA